MKTTTVLLTLAMAPAAMGFAPSVRPATRWLTLTQVTRLSEIDDQPDKNPEKYKEYEAENDGIKEKSDSNQGPTSYANFIDAEGFDGGDGQVGVVGSDEMEGEKTNSGIAGFDDSSVRHGMESQAGTRKLSMADDDSRSESKKTQRNAFGTFSGYAEDLADQGMTDVDEYGDDKLAARRQQLENWRNQRELKSQQQETLTELAGFTGTEYDPRAGTATYMNRLNANEGEDESGWNVYKGEAKVMAGEGYAEGLTIGTDYAGTQEITQTIDVTCSFPSPSFYEIKVENDVISFEDFVIGWADGSDGGDFQITPTAGELNRRGGEPTILSVVFKPNAPGGTRSAHLIVQTEESKWTYHLTGPVM